MDSIDERYFVLKMLFSIEYDNNYWYLGFIYKYLFITNAVNCNHILFNITSSMYIM
jgi:hypothetical protein